MNQKTCIETKSLFLVPYLSGHVAKYHDWMRSEEMQRLTSSEPLSLDQEYSHQKSWVESSDRITFIILEKDRFKSSSLNSSSSTESFTLGSKADFTTLVSTKEENAMIGDVNFYLIPVIDSSDQSIMEQHTPKFDGEISVMIAEPTAQRKGLAAQALAGILLFAQNHFVDRITAVVAKISLDNHASLKLFREKLGFIERNRNVYFNEVELVCPKLCNSDPSSVAADAAAYIISRIDVNGSSWFHKFLPVDCLRKYYFQISQLPSI